MISTSDGLVFNSEHEFETHLFTHTAMNTEGMRRSENMEDARTQADKWGDSFGPSEGGPPAGIDPNTWYNDSMLKILDSKTKIDAAQQIQRDITDKFGRTSDPSVLNSAEDIDKVPPYIQEKEREDDPGAGEESNPMN